MYQERELTDQTQPLVAHSQHPEDIVLNTAQMRDAIHVQTFRLCSPILEENEIVTANAAMEVASQKAARKVMEVTSAAKTTAPQQVGQPWRLAALQAIPRASTSGVAQINM